MNELSVNKQTETEIAKDSKTTKPQNMLGIYIQFKIIIDYSSIADHLFINTDPQTTNLTKPHTTHYYAGLPTDGIVVDKRVSSLEWSRHYINPRFTN